MTEDTTQGFLKLSPFEERVLAELAAMRSEFCSELGSVNVRLLVLENRTKRLEDKVKVSSGDTRPIWEDVPETFEDIKREERKPDNKLDIVIEQFELARNVKYLNKRMTKLETFIPQP